MLTNIMLIFFRRKKDALLAESNPLFFPAAESFLCLFRINRLSVCAEYVVTPAAGRFDRALRRKRVPWDVIHVVPHTVYRVERVFTALLPNKIAHTVFIVALLYQRAFIVNIVLEPEQLFIEQLWMAQIDRVFRYIMTVFHAQANVQLGKQRRRQEQNSVFSHCAVRKRFAEKRKSLRHFR